MIARQIEDLHKQAEHIAFKVWYYETALKEGVASLGAYEDAIARYQDETGKSVVCDGLQKKKEA